MKELRSLVGKRILNFIVDYGQILIDLDDNRRVVIVPRSEEKGWHLVRLDYLIENHAKQGESRT